MNPYLWKRLWRRPWLSLLSLILSGVLCFLLCYLSGYQAEQQAKLLDTQENYDILCVVTNRKGTQASALRMGSSAAYFVREGAFAELIRDVQITKEFQVSSMQLGISDAALLGVTNEKCAEELDSAMGGSVTWLEDSFYDREDYVCIVSEEKYTMLEELEVTFHVMDLFVYPEVEDAGIGDAKLRVVGYYAGSGNTVFMPFPASQQLCMELSNRLSSDSIAFYAKDNLQLEALSNAASEMFGPVDPTASDFSVPRVALTIHDEQYRATVAALEQNLERTRYLLPLLLVMALGTGFLVSFLGTRGETRTYALMRTVGLTRDRLFLSVLWEQTVLPLVGAFVVGMYMGQWLPAAFYIVCNTVGCCGAVIPAVRVAPTAILREQE